MKQIFSPNGGWYKYQIRIGYDWSYDAWRITGALEIQAPTDAAAEHFASALTDAMYGDKGWGPHYEIERLP